MDDPLVMDAASTRDQNPASTDTLVFVLAGGEGKRLRPLTINRPKPTLPFAGNARVIDFTLANCVKSGLSDVHVLGQYRSEALRRHLCQRWQHVNLHTPRPQDRPAGYRGTAHAVACNLDALEAGEPQRVLVAAADHVYWMDYAQLLQAHRDRGAAVTVAGIEVDIAAASRFGVIALNGDSRIAAFEEKPEEPTPLPARPDRALVSMGIYVFEADVLRRWLGDGGGRVRPDFGHHVVPSLVAAGEAVYAHVFSRPDSGEPGFWRDIGTLHSYWRTSLEMVHPASTHRVFRGAASMPGCGCQSSSRRLEESNVLSDAVISCGPAIHRARIERSILCCGVTVGAGVHVEDSVVLEGARIGRGARLRGVVVDRYADIPPGVSLQSQHPDPWGGGPQALSAVVPGPRPQHEGAPPTSGHCQFHGCGDGCGCPAWGSVNPFDDQASTAGTPGFDTDAPRTPPAGKPDPVRQAA